MSCRKKGTSWAGPRPEKHSYIDKIDENIEDSRKTCTGESFTDRKEINVANFCHKCDFNLENSHAKLGFTIEVSNGISWSYEVHNKGRNYEGRLKFHI